MITFPNAKINIGLSIMGRRSDGYHNLSSCFYPVEWSDILEIIPDDKLSFKSTGIVIPGDPSNNLCMKAYGLLKKAYDIPPVKIHLHKVIPIGAGLGGGSSDGAFAIKLLNAIYELSLSLEEMEDYASQLGSDCPFFIQNVPTYVEGTGDIFSPINIDLSEKHLVLVYPGIHISTKEAYQAIIPQIPEVDNLLAIENTSIDTWQDLIENDFESALIGKYPAIKELKQSFLDHGALYTSMTGSGSTVYGIFDKKPILAFPESYVVHHITPVID